MLRSAPKRLAAIRAGVTVTAGVTILAGALAPTAGAARLVGGREQGQIHRAYSALRAARGRVVVSIRISSVSGTWAIVRSVAPRAASSTRAGSGTARLGATFLDHTGTGWRPGNPPGAVRADLDRPFSVAVVYSGSGGESIGYSQTYRSICAGAGGFVDTQTDTVSPMRWTVRYVVDLDRLLAAVGTASDPGLVPAVTFDRARSRISASETLTRTSVDNGCNGATVRRTCTSRFGFGGGDPAGQLALAVGSGLAVGVPLRPVTNGTCDPGEYTLGPSLWDSGGAAAFAAHLGLLGGALPAKPYAPIPVSWTAGSAQQELGFVASPCQSDVGACADSFHWTGTVTIVALGR